MMNFLNVSHSRDQPCIFNNFFICESKQKISLQGLRCVHVPYLNSCFHKADGDKQPVRTS